MPRGFEHDDGWFDILWRLCEDLEPLVASVEAVPFISFASHHRGNGGGMWEKMYHYFQFKHTEFLQHYHKRRNVESTFSMMKREFGDGLRSKTDVAMVNESLCNILS
jgi:transposase